MKKIRYLLLGISTAAALIAAVSSGATANPAAPLKRPGEMAGAVMRAASVPREEMVSSLMVKPRQQAGSKLGLALQVRDASALIKTASVAMAVMRPMSGGAHVLKLDRPVTLTQARAIAARLMQDASVELAEPDRIMRAAATTPTDPDYAAFQWHYFAPAGANLGGANLPNAWDRTKGSAAITVAVLDTGYLRHADLGLGTVWPGQDFISDITRANDGDGRDADARDPGDSVAKDECGAGEPADDSGWHGTYVTGIIAAEMNNSIGGTGIAPAVKILPVRVLGKCGGLTSDIVDGMRWAAGIAVTGVPQNMNPAHVLNMSLSGSGACSAAFQSAVNDVVAAGKIIVAPTGNGAAAAVEQPANCSGVIAVTAHAIDGDNASYASVGAETAISAPGGGCGTLASKSGSCRIGFAPNGLGVYSLGNTGKTAPDADGYVPKIGTSAAVPHVSGVIALMLSANAALTQTQIKSYLKSSARPHPAASTCTSSTNIGFCGEGLLDGAQAVNAAIDLPPSVTLTNPYQVATSNQVVALSSTVTAGGNPIASFDWSPLAGNPASVTLTNASSANASFTPSTTGTYAFTLTVTDSAGKIGRATASVKVNAAVAAPAASGGGGGGGGGSLDRDMLMALVLMAAFLRFYRVRASLKSSRAGRRK